MNVVDKYWRELADKGLNVPRGRAIIGKLKTCYCHL